MSQHPGGYQSQGPVMYVRVLPTDGLCVTSFVLALLGFNIIAVIFGHVGLRRVKQTGAPGAGWAIAGLIIGYMTLAAILVVVAIAVVAVWWGVSASGS